MKKRNLTNLIGDIAADVIGGLLVAVSAYNFASAAEFPMVGLNGIGLILYHLFGLPIGVVSFVLNIPGDYPLLPFVGEAFYFAFHENHRNHFGNHRPGSPAVSCL